MRTFSKIAFICNVCFIIDIIILSIDNKKNNSGTPGMLKLQPVEATLAILGCGAIIINLIFFLVSLYWIFSGKFKKVPLWIVLFNLVLFSAEIYYFS